MPIIGLAFAPWALLSKRGAYTACRTYAAYTMWSARWMIGLRCEVRGTPPEGAVLVAAKHQSFLDILMIYHALPLPKFIYKKQLRWAPVIGQYLLKMQMIAVDRGKRGKAIAKMLNDVKSGALEPGQLVIYPQGTRVRPGLKADFKAGTGILYEQLGQPCVPVATNAGVFWPRRGLYRRPGVAVVSFLEPIAPGKSRKAFMQELEDRIEENSAALLMESGFGKAYATD
ncbi:lysophospholipid acyltransferase family protein [uncultured Sulfitobacter sp.]|uniref:lysophospholipid acyltransferase family protein n=1 Tax=uncultured Sulfitobacter sp. TaxID=191468 RepID=UPI00261B564E|nr:lysophospholipid acyltransferase family protein [uncultured Sulfitobacter sp.]